MTRRTFIWGLLFAGTVAAQAGNKSSEKPLKPVPKEKPPKEQVIAYYFHRTVRCEMCQDMELQARKVIERRFAIELANKRLLFKTVNLDQPENQANQEKYKLAGPSLVVARLKDGKDTMWKLLDQSWEYFGNPKKFDKYIETEVDKFLRNTK